MAYTKHIMNMTVPIVRLIKIPLCKASSIAINGYNESLIQLCV